MKKRLISLLLILCLFISAFPVCASATGDPVDMNKVIEEGRKYIGKLNYLQETGSPAWSLDDGYADCSSFLVCILSKFMSQSDITLMRNNRAGMILLPSSIATVYYSDRNRPSYKSKITAGVIEDGFIKRLKDGDYSRLQVGDIIMMSSYYTLDNGSWDYNKTPAGDGHVMLYTGNGNILEMCGAGCREVSLDDAAKNYRKRMYAVIRLKGAYTCEHNTNIFCWNSSAVCNKCGTPFPFQYDNSYRTGTISSLIVTAKSDPTTQAGSTGFFISSSKVEITSSTVDPWGHTWYYVTGGIMSGWVQASAVKDVKNATPAGNMSASIFYDGSKTNPNIKIKTGVTVSGTITSKYPIKSVVCQFVNTDNGKVSSSPKPQTRTFNTTEINVLKDLDPWIWYGQIPAGNFALQLVITDSYGNVKAYNGNSFSVTASAPAPVTPQCAEPSISVQDTEEGQLVSAVTSTAGATVTISAAGMTASGIGSASLVLRQSADVSVQVTKSGYITAGKTRYVTVNQCSAPLFTNLGMTAEGLKLQLTGLAGQHIYYRINGGAVQEYTAPFCIQGSSTIAAWASLWGSVSSGYTTEYYSLTAPQAPAARLVSTAPDIPVGNSITIGWNRDPNAHEYSVNVYKDDVLISTERGITEPMYTYSTASAGIYSITVTAGNIIGTSPESAAVKAEAHDPLTVSFLNYDGSVLISQTVRYGSDAEAPAAPARRGYTFSGWDHSFTKITEDTDVTALFKINTYTIKFYDCDGETPIGTEYVDFDLPVSTEEAVGRVSLDPGWTFTGWHIRSCDVGSEQDLEHIDSDMSLVATKAWGIETLPVVVRNLSASRNADATGYNVHYEATVAPEEIIRCGTQKVKFIATLKNSDDQMLGTNVITVNLSTGIVDQSVDAFISYNGSYLADKIEITTVGIDGNDHTGGALSEMVSATPTIEINYTPWMTEEELIAAGKNIDDADVSSKQQYRYTDYRRTVDTTTTKDGNIPARDGWTYLGRIDHDSTWTDWSYWSDYTIYGSDVREVRTQSVLVSSGYYQYRYGRWQSGSGANYCNTTCLKYYGGTPYLSYTPWYNYQIAPTGTRYTCGWIGGYGNHNHMGNYSIASNGNPVWESYNIGGSKYFWEEVQWVPDVYKTQWSYRDKLFIYQYEQWNETANADWSDTVYAGFVDTNDKRIVEERTLYRYITSDTSITEQETTSDLYSFTGTLSDAQADYEGKLATVLIYKETNSDPTEPQLEYVGQTVIGEGNSYTFDARTKEVPSAVTGDYIVSLALEGASNVVNIDKINAPGTQYKVRFIDYDGRELLPEGLTESQTVSEGNRAAVPEAPKRDGYRFVCWSTDTSYIQRDLTVNAVYVPEEFSVAIVDFENETVTLKTDYEYGDVLIIPDTPSKEGMRFKNWKIIRNSTGEVIESDEVVITDDLVVTAVWEPIQYSVVFYDADNHEYSRQTVAHGGSAQLPAAPEVSSDQEFYGWSTDSRWWDVTEDLSVYPIIVYKNTAMQPLPEQSVLTGTGRYIEFECDPDAKIYYTISEISDEELVDPEPGTEGTMLYEGPFYVSDTVQIRARAYKEKTNPSEIVEVLFWYVDGLETLTEIDTIEVGTYNIVAEPGKTVTLNVNIENNPGLAAYLFTVDADPEVFYVPYDEAADTAECTMGSACSDGYLLTTPYQVGTGWQILWFGNSENNGTLCTLTLRVSEYAAAGTYPIKVSYSPSNTFDDCFISSELPGLSVGFANSSEYMIGDVNGDKIINSYDIVLILKYVVRQITIASDRLFLLDVNGDGAYNTKDAVYLARYIVGLESTLGGN